MITVFWISVAFILFAYAGYPLSMYLLSKYKGKTFDTNDKFQPFVSIIIASGNEGSKIYDKLVNTIELQYNGPMEIIVSLDGATDDTAEQVEMFNKDLSSINRPPVKILINEKGGKESAQLAAIKKAKGYICVFTDVATTLGPKTIQHMVRHFFDEKVGAVDGMSKVVKDGHSSEGVYLKYENKIREWESATAGLVTLGGCLFAARSDLLKIDNKKYPGFVAGLSSDFRTALVTRTYDKQAVLDTDAVAEFKDGDESKEFSRKHRTIVRGINNVFHDLHLLNPVHYGWFSYALFGHKIAKWLVPFFMIGAFVSNIALINSGAFWVIMFAAQPAFYTIAFAAHIGKSKNKISKLVMFFVVSNVAILKAWLSYIRGERYVSWAPTKR